MGSPPRMRGKGIVHVLVPEPLGITPAYAGKSDNFVAALSDFGDHPRVCGEKPDAPSLCVAPLGSPPRMRGKVAAISAYNAAPGITPAYAGKSTLHRDDAPLSWDHPRVCGEKTKIKRPFTVNAGSPPRMRGKVLAARLYDLVNGITPAYAGKSDCLFQHGALFQDHPRVCGEKKKVQKSQ